MKKSVLYTAVSAVTLLMAQAASADSITGTAKADFNNDEIQVPCVQIEGYGEELDGQYFDIIMKRRGASFNYELVLAELEDTAMCEDIANYAIFVDDDADDDSVEDDDDADNGDDSSDDDDTSDDDDSDDGTTDPEPAPDISFNAETFDYGEFAVDGGSTSTQSLNIINTGDADLSIAAVELAGTNPDDYRITIDTGESTILAGERRTIAIVFDPSETGERTAVVKITSDDPDSPDTEIVLTGVGT